LHKRDPILAVNLAALAAIAVGCGGSLHALSEDAGGNDEGCVEIQTGACSASEDPAPAADGSVSSEAPILVSIDANNPDTSTLDAACVRPSVGRIAVDGSSPCVSLATVSGEASPLRRAGAIASKRERLRIVDAKEWASIEQIMSCGANESDFGDQCCAGSSC
jgi:hypothetical protein